MTGISTQCSGLTETQPKPKTKMDNETQQRLDDIADQIRILEIEVDILISTLDLINKRTKNTQND